MSDAVETETISVSYGIFSCSITGSEKPVELIMEITKFFSDIAEKDDHFGAERSLPASSAAAFLSSPSRAA